MVCECEECFAVGGILFGELFQETCPGSGVFPGVDEVSCTGETELAGIILTGLFE